MAEHTPVRDAPWKKRIDPRKVRGTYPFQRGAPNLQQRSWARCDEDYSCRYKTSCQNQLPQLQGGHVSHKTFSKSTPPVCRCRGGTCPTKRSLRAPLQCVPVKSKKSKSKPNPNQIKNFYNDAVQIENTEKRKLVQSSCSSCRQRRRSCSSCYTSPLPSSRTSSGKGR